MRLLTKTTISYLLLTLLVFTIGGVVTLSLVRDAVREETDYALRRALRRYSMMLAAGAGPEAISTETAQIVRLDATARRDTLFSDTLIRLERTGQTEDFRKLTVVGPVEGQLYKFEIVGLFFEDKELVDVVTAIMIRLFLLVAVALLIGSLLISQQLLKPFEKVLGAIRRFSLRTDQPLALAETNTTEFRQLNAFLAQMTEKARTDYRSLKEFTENASHEMQTPLAVARGKLELLQQSPNLTNEQLTLIESAQQSLSKLSKLGQALTLLTRIENQEFGNEQTIPFTPLIERNIATFAELAELRGLDLQSELTPNVMVRIDALLADILVTNLLRNALQHNQPGGWIKVSLTEQRLRVRNSGEAPSIPPAQLFERFRKSNATAGSLGLGLAIVKKIADVHRLQVDYRYGEGEHVVEVKW